MINARARVLFGLSSKDIGRPLNDYEEFTSPVDLFTAVIQLFFTPGRPLDGVPSLGITYEGVRLAGLGNLVLRAETAPLAALAAIRHGWGWS